MEREFTIRFDRRPRFSNVDEHHSPTEKVPEPVWSEAEPPCPSRGCYVLFGVAVVFRFELGALGHCQCNGQGAESPNQHREH